MASLGLRHGISTLSLRYGNVYGPRQDGTGEAGVVAITCHRLRDRRPPLGVGRGNHPRDFVFVLDVVAATPAALASRRSGFVNVGTGDQTSVRRVVETLLRC